MGIRYFLRGGIKLFNENKVESKTLNNFQIKMKNFMHIKIK